MAGLDPAIHHASKESCGRAMDPRVKPGGDNPLADASSELALGLLTRVGLLALTARILLLLTGLLSAALLLAGLLTRVLILLARILVLVSHRDLRC
jgi:hypothetical protein